MSALAEPRVEAPRSAPSLNLVDPQNPWLGLDSFSEETRQFFHGREQEVAELARRAQDKLLTILFGQSGLGKTSILRAGIVPRLRSAGHCPVYVRLDYAQGTPSPSEQIKQAVFRETEALGKWTRPGTAVAGESLWEFLHHRDDVLRDAAGKTLTPLLIFDQFEEIFTLAQDDDFGRRRAAEFIEDLADLVENRAPAAIEQMLDSDDSVADRFDFNRADYRILISLREDYLANLEAFRGSMPAVTQNRMRLARMTGQQALAAVTKPGGHLVNLEVAESIVRFVAGGAELRNADVEPSLLSLICRELNNARVAQGRAEISADLIAGSRETILKEFYERAIGDQPHGVRRFVEDEMLTESGFRESLAQERVQRAFSAAGAAPGALATLVNRRLLRIEERLDLRRVELMHDVLCKVVVESRDARHEREARDEMERQLEAERAGKAAAHRALVRARQVAFGCGVLAIAAIGSAIWGLHSSNRAQEAEARAGVARGEAEKLVVYLLDDFYLELEPVGRLDIVGELSKRAIAYYDALPESLRTPETQRNRALALVRYGFVLRRQAKLDESVKALDDAISVLARLRAAGDVSESAAIGHALALSARGRLFQAKGQSAALARPPCEQAVAILAPLAAKADSSVALRRANAQALTGLAFVDMNEKGEEAGLKALDIAREAFRGVDGLSLKDLASAAGFVDVSAAQMGPLSNLRREGEARTIGGEALEVATRILDNRPGHMTALRSRAALAAGLSFVELQDLNLRRSISLADAAFADYEALLKLDPGNAFAWNELASRHIWVSFAAERLGRVREGITHLRAVLDIDRRAGKNKSDFLNVQLGWAAGELAAIEADLGNDRQSAEALARSLAYGDTGEATLPKESFYRGLRQFERYDLQVALISDDAIAARDKARAFIARVEPLKPNAEQEGVFKNFHLAWANQILGAALLVLKDFTGAETALRSSLKYTDLLPWHSRLDVMNKYDAQVLLGMALARQGKLEPARAVLEPVLALHRGLPAEAREDVAARLQLAQALLGVALASPAQRAAHLAEAARVLDTLPPEFAGLRTVARVHAAVTEEKGRHS